MIKVLIVDDSAIAREFLRSILSPDPDIEVIGTVGSGMEAFAFMERQKPDLILMDMAMPEIDGFKATRQIMETSPVPIVIVTGSVDYDSVSSSFGAMEAGAVTLLEKPKGIGHPDHQSSVSQFIAQIKSMSEVRVIRRWPQTRAVQSESQQIPALTSAIHAPLNIAKPHGHSVKLVAIGASTGGPIVLSTIFKGLPKEFPVPLLLVQHIAPGFVQGLVDWLNGYSKVPISLATQGEPLLPGHAYVAPDNRHLGVRNDERTWLNDSEPISGLRPAVSFLFSTVAEVYGSEAIGVLLTGMGKDGARELKLMRDRGAITIAQDEATSVVHGMPGEAINLGGATHILPAEKIARTLVALTHEHDA